MIADQLRKNTAILHGPDSARRRGSCTHSLPILAATSLAAREACDVKTLKEGARQDFDSADEPMPEAKTHRACGPVRVRCRAPRG